MLRLLRVLKRSEYAQPTSKTQISQTSTNSSCGTMLRQVKRSLSDAKYLTLFETELGIRND